MNLHKDGKKYGVHFDNYDVTPSSNGTRLFDAVGMAAAPSTNTVRAVNDFDGKGCFAYLEVNGSVDENGEFQVQYIKDIDNEFSRTKYDTWCLYLTQYVYRKFDSNGEDTVISDTRHSAEWLPEGGAIRPDGTIRPFVQLQNICLVTMRTVLRPRLVAYLRKTTASRVPSQSSGRKARSIVLKPHRTPRE